MLIRQVQSKQRHPDAPNPTNVAHAARTQRAAESAPRAGVLQRNDSPNRPTGGMSWQPTVLLGFSRIFYLE